MFVNSIKLNNIRNYESLDISFDPNINIICGDNAQGKTNILESIFLCATTRSHKGSRDREIIRFGEDEGHIRMEIVRHDVLHTIDMHLRKNKSKVISIDGSVIHRAGDLLGMCHLVFFSPEDLSIVKDGPSERRRFMDTELCQMDRVYLSYLSRYNRVLNQRNNLLRNMAYDSSQRDMLPVWNDQLVKYGSYIIERRSQFIEKLNVIARRKHSEITGGEENLELIYEPSTEAADFMEKLVSRQAADERSASTGAGPHRDDIKFLSNDIDVRKFGSQGQQRTAALTLKLSEIEIVRESVGEAPVLLLDDVLSELDSKRQNYLLDSISNVQVIITCTGLDEFVNHRMHLDRVYQVVSGRVSSMNSK